MNSEDYMLTDRGRAFVTIPGFLYASLDHFTGLHTLGWFVKYHRWSDRHWILNKWPWFSLGMVLGYIGNIWLGLLIVGIILATKFIFEVLL